MTYAEYKAKYNYAYGHENYECGERMVASLEDLLETLKDNEYPCPDEVDGGIPVKMTIDIGSAIDGIEQDLYDNDFSGEDYEMPLDGVEFLKKCFAEYNEKYANNGNYCDSVTVIVPDEMKYWPEEKE
jgi:hypothetical protein